MVLTYTVVYDHVNVETAADGSGSIVSAQNVSLGSSITGYAIGRASDNSFMSNAPASWSLVNKTGAVADSDLVASGDTRSAVFTAHLSGTANIKAVIGAATANTSGTITVPSTGVIAVWTNNVDGNWTDATKWGSNPSIPSAAGDTAILGVGTALRTVTLNANETIGVLNLTNNNSFVVTGGNVLTLDNAGNGAVVSVSGGTANAIQSGVALKDNSTITVNGGKSLTVSGTIANTSAAKTLTINGAGTTVLSTANTFGPASSGTVGTALSGGTLQVGNNASLGAGDVTNVANATLQSGAAGLNIANNIGIGSGVTSTVDNNGNALTLSGVISGNGGLSKAGVGALTLGVNNTYAGSTTISAGTVNVSTDGASAGNAGNLGAVPASSTPNNIILNGGDLSATTTLALHANRGIGIGATSGTATTTALIDASSGTLTINGVIATAGNTGANNLTINGVSGSGTVVLAGANTFGGTTVIGAGTLQLANSLALQNSTLNYNNQGGSLSFGSLATVTLGGLSGAQSLALLNGSSSAVALTVGGNSINNNYSGGLSGTGASLTKAGTATFTLSGNNSYSGSSVVNAGVLEVSSGGVINGGTIGLTASANAQLLVDGGTVTSSALSTVGATGTLLESSGTTTFSGGLQTDLGSSVNSPDLISVTGGTLTASSLALGRTSTSTTTQPSTGSTTTGLYVNGGAVNITGNLNAGTVANANSTVNVRVDSGSLTVGGVLTIGLNNSGRWSVLDINGGTLTVNDTATGISVGGPLVGNAAFLVRNGTTTAGKISFGQGTTAETTVLSLTGGNLYVGSGGMAQISTGVGFVTTVTLAGGILGAANDWSSSLPMTLSGATIQAANVSSVAHNITLSGTLSGAGALTKTGGGTLALGASAGNSYAGNTTVSAGTLLANNTTGSGTSSGTVTVQTGATLGGTGIISGATTVNAGGTLAPGAGGIGTLTFATSPTVVGTNLMEINRNGGTPLADKIVVSSGALTKGGILTVTNVGAALLDGDSFTLFNASSYTGTFSATNLPTTGTGSNWLTTDNFTTLAFNIWPTAGAANYTRAKGATLKITISDLLTNVTGAVSGKTITLTGVGASTNGATIATNGTYIFYTPANDNNESFTYTVSDGRGGSPTGVINLTVASAAGPAQITGAPVNGVATIKFFGLPSYTYVVQTTTNLGTPWWNLGTNATDGNGIWNFTDNNATNTQQYYRLSQP